MTQALALLALYASIVGCAGQRLEPRDVDFYFDRVGALETDALLREGVLLDTATVAGAYRDPETGRLNGRGLAKYAEVKKEVYLAYFTDHLYLQHVAVDEYVYVLYLSMAGFDDIHWDVVRWRAAEWRNGERLSPVRLEADATVVRLFGNYDEGPKNVEDVRLYRREHYLVLDRGGLHHSLYDLQGQRVVLNEESPWHASGGADAADLDAWIHNHLHAPIDSVLRHRG